MRIRAMIEIGHTAQKKAKPQEGFTHDWELFVRNCDGNNISRFVERVVFNLHESFPKPTRTFREPPYIVKESGYGGFVLPIDIWLKAGPRDEPKLVSFSYDLDITKSHGIVKHQCIISNPSSEFKHRLIDGGGIVLTGEGHDDRSQDKSRNQLSSSSTATSGGGKIKKGKAEEVPKSTFENLFGPPIQNLTTSKHSPALNSSDSHKSQKSSSKDRSSEKSSKEKKEKSKSSNSKDGGGGSSTKDSYSKKTPDIERREEKRKDKSHTKDRDRSKEKSTKRPISPKSESRSPKRSASPASHRTTSSNSSRHESKLETSSTSGGKKSKKEKRDKSKERAAAAAAAAAAATGDSKKDAKDSKHQLPKQKDEKTASNKSLEKLNGSGKRDEGSNTPKDARDKYRTFDTKPPSPIDLPPKAQTPSDSKKTDKHDKDERKHKHKKEKKNKDKDKERKKDKTSKSKEADELNHRTVATAAAAAAAAVAPVATVRATTPQQVNRITSTKASTTPQPVIVPAPPIQPPFSEKSSSDFEMDDDYMARSPKSDIHEPERQSESPKKHIEKMATGKKAKEPKPVTVVPATNKDEKKQKKRKNKTEKQQQQQKHDDSGSSGGKRKLQSPLDDEPTAKYSKKDDEKSPKIQKSDATKLNRTPPTLGGGKSAPISSSTSSESIPSIPDNQPQSPNNEKTYIAQLKALQQKIMTLQDNDELQQVVEMIAATGCYEITSRTFDFDLCALDRTTVQRLQERLG